MKGAKLRNFATILRVLSIVATPIGNLKDITIRAKEALEACDAIVCEDTRVTGSLLKAMEIPKKELISFHGYSDEKKADAIMERLQAGEHIVLVSDAGTPGISDPGFVIVNKAREAGLTMESVPGPSAFLAALSVSGLPINQFVYLGFPPLKKGRQTLFASFAEEARTIVLYESVHRIEKTLHQIADALSDQPDRVIVIARELTKLHEEVIHTTVTQAKETAATLTKKGEFAVVIGPMAR